MTRHRFLNEGRSPIPMGATAEYICACGKRGTRAAIERHLAESPTDDPTPPVRTTAVVENEHFGGDTMAHYLPIEPRGPASSTDTPTPPELPPITLIADACPICGSGGQVANLPEIAAWSCGHWFRRRSRPIAEAFQDMLRSAYQAGTLAGASGETFESWYQREILQ